jgi:hypothetical protein
LIALAALGVSVHEGSLLKEFFQPKKHFIRSRSGMKPTTNKPPPRQSMNNTPTRCQPFLMSNGSSILRMLDDPGHEEYEEYRVNVILMEYGGI